MFIYKYIYIYITYIYIHYIYIYTYLPLRGGTKTSLCCVQPRSRYDNITLSKHIWFFELPYDVLFAHVGGTAPGNTSVFVVDLGWGGVGWGRDVTGHVNVFSTAMPRYNVPPCTLIWGGVGWGGAGMLTFM